jgi:predicted PurR-regulated permease PerM
LLLLILPLVAIAAAVAAQSAQLLRRLEQHVPEAGQALKLDLSGLPWIGPALEWLYANTGVTLVQLQGWLVEGSKNLLQALVSSGGSVLVGAVGTLTSFVLMLFVLFFVLLDGPRFARQLVPMLPIEERRRARLWQHLADVTRAVFMGIGLTALAQGVLVGIGFWIAGLPSPLVFGVVATFVALIPVVGAALVWAPAAAVLALQGDYGHAIFLTVWGVLFVGMADNVLRPLLISGRAEVPTLAVFVGVMGGLAAFGFVGLFLGPIVLGLLVALFRFEAEERAASPDAD